MSRCLQLASGLLTALALLASALPARAKDLYLETIINGTSTSLIAKFRQHNDGRMAIAPAEMAEIGLEPGNVAPDAEGLIVLDDLKGLSYRYDTMVQVIRIETGDENRKRQVIDARPEPAKPGDVANWESSGAVLNYRLFGTNSSFKEFGSGSAASALLDGRVFSGWGVFSQTGIMRGAAGTHLEALRLDSTWTYNDVETLMTYRAGDVISGGLSWTRPVRIGGVQVQRSFSLRPDLATMPLPQLSGSAAVPSTLDVYVNNMKTFSQNVPAGPFQLQNLPIVSGAGTARVVLHDATGRETVTNLPFYASAQLLRQGMLDFSAEAGAPRYNYGADSFGYDKQAVASGSMRYGFADWLTLEAHGEGAANRANGGVGVVMPLPRYGTASFAVAGSTLDGKTGALASASLEVTVAGVSLYARSQRTFGDYADLASLSKRTELDSAIASYLKQAKSIDQITGSIPLKFASAALSLNYTRLTDGFGERSEIIGASFSRPLTAGASLYATAFTELTRKNVGVMAGLTMSFDDGISASVSASRTQNKTTGSVDIVKTQPLEPGTYGWRVHDREGGGTGERAAAASYRSTFARVEAGVQQGFGGTRVSGEMEGAIAVVGGGVYAANRINDAFAVVDTGVPGVTVLSENRQVGVTDNSGKLLVPDLRSYQPNRIGIDPRNLPVDAQVTSSRQTVIPRDRGSAVVNFKVEQKTQAALIILRDAKGQPLAAGGQGRVEGGNETFLVGYDGHAYIGSLAAQNVVTIERAEGEPCRAEFAFTPNPGTQVVIKDVVCK